MGVALAIRGARRYVSPMQIRRLTLNDAAAWYALRLQMLAEGPGVFSASLADAESQGIAYAQERLQPQNHIFGAFTEGAPEVLLGAVGVTRSRGLKTRHKACIWGMYVRPDARRCGVGRGLVEIAIVQARQLPGVLLLELCVTSDAPAAQALYEDLGFERWGHEPAAMLVNERLIDEHHYSMWLTT